MTAVDAGMCWGAWMVEKLPGEAIREFLSEFPLTYHSGLTEGIQRQVEEKERLLTLSARTSSA